MTGAGADRREAVRLGYDVHGPDDAPVLMLGPSLGTTRAMWDPVLPVLGERLRVVRYDHLGHGASEVPPGPYTIGGLAAELRVLLDALDIRCAHVGGVSLGGMVAMELAAAAPERVDRLVVACSSAHMPPAQGWLDRAGAIRAGGMPAVADGVFARWFTPAFAASPEAIRCYEDLVRTPVEGYAGCCEAIAGMDLRPRLERIHAPTQVLAGADDPATPVERAEVIAAGIRDAGTPARLDVVDSAAHLGVVQQPAEFGRLMLEHLLAGEPVGSQRRGEERGAG